MVPFLVHAGDSLFSISQALILPATDVINNLAKNLNKRSMRFFTSGVRTYWLHYVPRILSSPLTLVHSCHKSHNSPPRAWCWEEGLPAGPLRLCTHASVSQHISLAAVAALQLTMTTVRAGHLGNGGQRGFVAALAGRVYDDHVGTRSLGGAAEPSAAPAS